MKTIVSKLSKSGKTMLVGHKGNKYQVGYAFGWCANPDGCKKGDELEDFKPRGTANVYNDNGEQLFHENGEPVLRWVF